MPAVLVEIVRFLDDWQPGFVLCQLTDASGRAWSFEEKVPLVTSEWIDSTSVYPRPGIMGCTVLESRGETVLIRVEPLNDDFECEILSSAMIDDTRV